MGRPKFASLSSGKRLSLMAAEALSADVLAESAAYAEAEALCEAGWEAMANSPSQAETPRHKQIECDAKDQDVLIGTWYYQDGSYNGQYTVARKDGGLTITEHSYESVLYIEDGWHVSQTKLGTIRLQLRNNKEPTVVSQFMSRKSTTWEDDIVARKKQEKQLTDDGELLRAVLFDCYASAAAAYVQY